ncbi:2-C-methyl-D-erythritol 2,4-cyclodiphosphate synthase [Endozoicomonas elysicola]|uniref:2-C-methyl-D-erythritol 2,4-cyclodiphosphate synthase n=1 Tax=Endozoicomonas elysicola TaxID=305900 RepID=A0A081KD25_9GAMM|nr:2-C-methyl-D-erythritol 2,4-cyclodiphosphate synthase [Endozoicomonas elysicola]KEI72051.1 2-C-methyl-D-erythritol 2,4-cyclodiphosphate synthase [Endozoicomonas elysicola]
MRIGHGFDVHRFGEGDHIVLGGVKIPHSHGLIAHSDGDVLLHALCDALLGAAGLGDIGKHFPDTDERYAGIDSRKLLRHVIALLKEQGLTPVNIDSTIIAQAPKMAPHIDQMRQNISEDMGIDAALVNVKATTTEKLGYTGRKEGIAVHAVVLLSVETP